MGEHHLNAISVGTRIQQQTSSVVYELAARTNRSFVKSAEWAIASWKSPTPVKSLGNLNRRSPRFIFPHTQVQTGAGGILAYSITLAVCSGVVMPGGNSRMRMLRK